MKKLLLDTHIWLWSLLEPGRLSEPVRRELNNPGNELWLSPISVWETLVLSDKGRIELGADPSAWVERALQSAPLREAPLTREVALATVRLDLAHRDPADRLITATAKVFDLTLVTADPALSKIRSVPVLRNE